MGAAKRQRTIEYFKRLGELEIAFLVQQSVAELVKKQAEQEKSEGENVVEEIKDEVTDIG